MQLLMNSVFLIMVSAIFLLLRWHVKKRRSHPPGPLGIPLLGMLPFQIIQAIFSNGATKMKRAKYLIDMKKKYGDYWSIEMGSQRIVVLSSWELINKAFNINGKLFSSRPTSEVYRLLGDNGILFSTDEVWANNRFLALKAIKEQMMEKDVLSQKITNDANNFVKYITSISLSPISFPTACFQFAFNVMEILIFNDTNAYGSADMIQFSKYSKDAFRSDILYKKCNVFPWLCSTKIVRSIFSDINNFFESWQNASKIIHNKIKNIKNITKPSEVSNGIFDFFWRERYPNCKNITQGPDKKETLQTMADLFIAGSESTSNIISFCCLYLGYHPKIQDDLKNEINMISEDHSQITYDMKKECPKLLSFIDEAHRYYLTITVFQHTVIESCTFNGYKLNPCDIIWADWMSVSRDPRIFENPDVFDPYRFMDPTRTSYISNKHMLTFGMGKRACIGETMAQMATFLCLSKLIKKFRISLPKKTYDNFNNIIDGTDGYTHGPLDHELILTPGDFY